MTYQIGQDAAVRSQFVNTQQLSNTVDTAYRAVNDNG